MEVFFCMFSKEVPRSDSKAGMAERVVTGEFLRQNGV